MSCCGNTGSSVDQVTDKQENNSDPEGRESIKKTPNPLRCPFAPRSESMKQNFSRHTKRQQRYRSTAPSRLGEMTVGDIRYCFQQLRNAGDELNSDMILYNGQCAGEFALQYLQETSNATKKRRKLNSVNRNSRKDHNDHDNHNDNHNDSKTILPSSQLRIGEGENRVNGENNKSKNNVLEF